MKRLLAMGMSVLAGWAMLAKDSVAAERKWGERKARIEEKQAEREQRKAEIQERVEANKGKREEAKARIEEAKAKWEERKAEVEARREKAIDNRQSYQSKRIEHGIKKGYLTSEEIDKLQSQQNAIADLETQFKSDGKLTKEEFRQLQTELNEASRCIWGEKHDTDGNQMPAYRLGKNVFAKDDFARKMADENLSKEEARAMLRDFRRATELKRLLAGDLEDGDRARLQAEYNDLLNKYFEVRE